MKKLCASALAIAALPGAACATLPTKGRVLGNAIRAHYLNNETIGRSGFRVAFRGQAPAAACYSTLQVYHIASDAKAGYSAGTGGTVRVHVETLNAGDLPSGVAVGGSATWTPSLASGAVPTGQDSHYLFHTYTLSSAACLAAGQKFVILFENVDPNQANNWLGVEGIAASGSAEFPALDPIWAVYMYEPGVQGGPWVRREPPYSTDKPIMRFCTAGGSCITQTYFQNGGSQPVGGAAKARQLLTSPAGGTVQTCYIDAARASTSVARVRVGLTTIAGAFLAGGAAYTDADASPLPVASTGLAGGQLKVTLPAPVTVGANGGWGGTTDYAQYNSGSGWVAWPGQGQLSDLSAYCELRHLTKGR
jgi:hypothetical protein